MERVEIKNLIANINNLLMEVTVKGDDVLRLAKCLDICHDIFNKLELEDVKSNK